VARPLTGPLKCCLCSLPARRAAAAGLFGASRVALAGPSLRLSGGAAGLQAAVLDGIKATDIDGKEVDLGKYSSVPAVLVVNLASGPAALRRSRRPRPVH
jgi:hypothetical protein